MSDFIVEIEPHADGRVTLRVTGETPMFVGPAIDGVPMAKGNCLRYFPGEEITFEASDRPLRIADQATVFANTDEPPRNDAGHYAGQHHQGGRGKTHFEGDDCPPCPASEPAAPEASRTCQRQDRSAEKGICGKSGAFTVLTGHTRQWTICEDCIVEHRVQFGYELDGLQPLPSDTSQKPRSLFDCAVTLEFGLDALRRITREQQQLRAPQINFIYAPRCAACRGADHELHTDVIASGFAQALACLCPVCVEAPPEAPREGSTE